MRIRTWCSVGLAAWLCVGCGGSKPPVREASPPSTAGIPLDSTARRLFVPAQDTAIASLVAGWPARDPDVAVPERASEPDLPAGPGALYRIQLFTSKSMSEAMAVRDEAALEFGSEVRVDYETPYYKVRVGRFATPQEAEPTLKRARQLGYRGAWAVRVRAAGTRD